MMVNNEFKISKENFLFMRLLANRCGIDLNEYREEALYNRLIRRLRILKLPDFDAYCRLLRVDIEEEIKFINLITNLTTFFFRESHHFEYLGESLLPELITKKNKIRIWSAGCSTGEEPYSIAIVLREVIPNIERYDIKVLATDINSDALTTAESGIYDINRIKKLDSTRQQTWFKQVGKNEANLVEVSHKLKSLITFRQLNLMDVWPIHGPFDAIFCRNVLIYFKKDIGLSVLEKFTKLLANDGVLFIGYSETLSDLRELYTPIGKTMYRKNVSEDK